MAPASNARMPPKPLILEGQSRQSISVRARLMLSQLKTYFLVSITLLVGYFVLWGHSRTSAEAGIHFTQHSPLPYGPIVLTPETNRCVSRFSALYKHRIAAAAAAMPSNGNEAPKLTNALHGWRWLTLIYQIVEFGLAILLRKSIRWHMRRLYQNLRWTPDVELILQC